MNDTIHRQAAIDAAIKADMENNDGILSEKRARVLDEYISNLPSAQPYLYGYDVEHLKLIARVLQKENLPPEKVAEVINDTGRIISIAVKEYEEFLREAVRQCMT